MPEFNRRKFLIASAGAGAVGLLGGVGALTLPVQKSALLYFTQLRKNVIFVCLP